MTIPSAHDWIREIKPEIKQLDSIPLTGAGPSFPWDQLASRLAQTFNREISLQTSEPHWRTKDEIYEGLGDSPLPLTFVIPPFRGSVYWLMPEQDIAILEALILAKNDHSLSFQDRTLSESFYRFLALEALYQMSQVNYDKTIIPILISHSNLPADDALCCDITLKVENRTLLGRLVISKELRQSWADHYSKQGPSQLTKELAEQVEVLVHLEAGRIHLTYQEWDSLQLGDFIVLENCQLDPQKLTGPIMITLNGKNIFRASIEDDRIKILEIPTYYEVETPMAKQNSHESDDDEFDDFDDLDDSLSDDDFLTDEEFDDLSPMVEETGAVEHPEPAPSVPILEENTPQPSQTPVEEGLIATNQIPVALVVEIGSIQMSMQKLLQLEPGNVLELGIHPENGVNLVVNGKCVGKGELIKLGNALGVRVTNLGKSSTR